MNPTREDYIFGGWYLDSDFTERIYAISDCAEDVTVYAKWLEPSYNIYFFENDWGAYGEMEGLSGCESGKTYTLPLNTYENYGNRFLGWKDENGVFYADGAKFSRICTGFDETITLYAQWELIPYKITYVLNGGTNNKENPNTYNVNMGKIYFEEPTRSGYIFDGWYTDSAFKNEVTRIDSGYGGDITLYAKWIADKTSKVKYTITYKLNGGTNNKKNPSCYYSDSEKITFKNPTRKGYVLFITSEGDCVTT